MKQITKNCANLNSDNAALVSRAAATFFSILAQGVKYNAQKKNKPPPNKMGKTNEKNNRNNHSNVKIATKPPIFANANETKRYVDRLKTDIFCVLLTKTIWQMYNITQLILKWTFYGYARTAQEKAVGSRGYIWGAAKNIISTTDYTTVYSDPKIHGLQMTYIAH